VTDLHLRQGSRARAPRLTRPLRRLTGALFTALLLASAALAEKPTPDTYEATLTGVSATGITLKIEILNWSDAEARETVVATLGEETEVAKALDKLPSVGAVWQSGSAVGHSVKYAHRVMDADGTQHIVVVTSKPLDAFSFKPWTLTSGTGAARVPYDVIELKLDAKGNGTGTSSLAAEVAIDSSAHTVGLKTTGGTPTLLTGVKLLPKPYWASH